MCCDVSNLHGQTVLLQVPKHFSQPSSGQLLAHEEILKPVGIVLYVGVRNMLVQLLGGISKIEARIFLCYFIEARDDSLTHKVTFLHTSPLSLHSFQRMNNFLIPLL